MAEAYAIGDVHGQLEKLKIALELVERDRAKAGAGSAPVVFLGDLVDRGPDSRGVVAHLIDGLGRGEPWLALRGNHDRMFARFLADPLAPEPGLRPGLDWLHPALGGLATLASYGVSPRAGRRAEAVHAEAVELVPEAHRAFLDGLPPWHKAGEALFVHAGIRPGVALKDQAEDDLVWIRAEFLYDLSDHGALVVHGHTPIEQVTHYGNRLNLDTGAGYGGPVSVVALERRDAWLLTPKGRRKLAPVGD